MYFKSRQTCFYSHYKVCKAIAPIKFVFGGISHFPLFVDADIKFQFFFHFVLDVEVLDTQYPIFSFKSYVANIRN